MVPDAEFTSYYGRPILKRAAVGRPDIPVYLFLGGLAGGSSLLGAGADLTGRAGAAPVGPARRAAARSSASFAALVHDLGRPARFLHMLRVFKPTSPMSVGTWILAAYGPLAGAGCRGEAAPLLPRGCGRACGTQAAGLGRGAGLAAAALGPAVASYTAVLLADTATPPGTRPAASCRSSSSAAPRPPPGERASCWRPPARRPRRGGWPSPERRWTSSPAGPWSRGWAGRRTAAPGTGRSTAEGGQGAQRRGAVLRRLGGLPGLGRGRRGVSAVAGGCLLAGSVCTRFGLFHAGQQSARDPRYTVVPQRERLDLGAASAPQADH